tara:strand:+ start:492 stop:1331 length:840 start_codon:yes stop_codon:yes gene_type:complete
MFSFNNIKNSNNPLKFLIAKILIRIKLCTLFTIKQEHYVLKFHPTGLARDKWVDVNYTHAAEDNFFLDYVKKNNTVIDVGANIGTVTLLLANIVGKNGNVYSIEPHPTTHRYLVENIKLNKFENVTTFNIALGEKSMQVNFSNFKSDDQNKILNLGSKLSIKMSKLDDLPIKESMIDLLKIDTIGYEKFVLLGANSLLKKCKVVQFPIGGAYHKFSDYYGYDFKEVLDILRKNNFRLYSYDQKKTLSEILDYVIPPEGDLLAIADINDFLTRTGYSQKA